MFIVLLFMVLCALVASACVSTSSQSVDETTQPGAGITRSPIVEWESDPGAPCVAVRRVLTNPVGPLVVDPFWSRTASGAEARGVRMYALVRGLELIQVDADREGTRETTLASLPGETGRVLFVEPDGSIVMNLAGRDKNFALWRFDRQSGEVEFLSDLNPEVTSGVSEGTEWSLYLGDGTPFVVVQMERSGLMNEPQYTMYRYDRERQIFTESPNVPGIRPTIPGERQLLVGVGNSVFIKPRRWDENGDRTSFDPLVRWDSTTEETVNLGLTGVSAPIVGPGPAAYVTGDHPDGGQGLWRLDHTDRPELLEAGDVQWLGAGPDTIVYSNEGQLKVRRISTGEVQIIESPEGIGHGPAVVSGEQVFVLGTEAVLWSWNASTGETTIVDDEAGGLIPGTVQSIKLGPSGTILFVSAANRRVHVLDPACLQAEQEA